MNKFLAVILFLTCAAVSFAQRPLLLTGGGCDYSDQQYYHHGQGNNFPQSEVNSYISKGLRLTSVAYNDKGWSFAFSNTSTIISQKLVFSFTLNDSIFEEMQADGYCLTSMAAGPKDGGRMMCMVFSKCPNVTRQHYYVGSDWNIIKLWIEEQWSERYFVTAVYNDGNQLYLVSTLDPDFEVQGYFRTNTLDKMKSTLVDNLWNKGYWVDNINYNANGYLVFYSKRKSISSDVRQAYSIAPNDIIEKVKENWRNGNQLISIGGLPSELKDVKCDYSTQISSSIPSVDIFKQKYINTVSNVPYDNELTNVRESDMRILNSVADSTGLIYSGVYTFTGMSYSGDEVFDIGSALLALVDIYVNKIVVNGNEYPFSGWINTSDRCYCSGQYMFTMTKDLSLDCRQTSNQISLVYGMHKGNLVIFDNLSRESLPEDIGVYGDFVCHATAEEDINRNMQIIEAQWDQVSRRINARLNLNTSPDEIETMQLEFVRRNLESIRKMAADIIK